MLFSFYSSIHQTHGLGLFKSLKIGDKGHYIKPLLVARHCRCGEIFACTTTREMGQLRAGLFFFTSDPTGSSLIPTLVSHSCRSCPLCWGQVNVYSRGDLTLKFENSSLDHYSPQRYQEATLNLSSSMVWTNVTIETFSASCFGS